MAAYTGDPEGRLAKDTKGNAVEQEFTTYVTISDGIDPDATTEAVAEPVAEELPTFAPKVMVKSYKYDENQRIQPGDGVKGRYRPAQHKQRKYSEEHDYRSDC